ncbi:MAG: GNAT family N-acetyltransferase [Candidatus Micrarchaeota archaeon]
MELKIRLARNKHELNQVLRIREIVFIKGQNVPKDLEMDGLDGKSKHAIVFYKNKPIGCARIRLFDRKAKLERIAILKEYRGKRVGGRLVQYLIDYCKRRKVEEVILHSQCYIKKFYEQYGFKSRGEIFIDAGIRHIGMYLRLS